MDATGGVANAQKLCMNASLTTSGIYRDHIALSEWMLLQMLTSDWSTPFCNNHIAVR